MDVLTNSSEEVLSLIKFSLLQVFASCTREFDNDNKAWCSTKTDSQVSTAMHSKVPGTPNQTTTSNSPSTDSKGAVSDWLKEKSKLSHHRARFVQSCYARINWYSAGVRVPVQSS